MKTLLECLDTADAIEIDDNFIRHFSLNVEDEELGFVLDPTVVNEEGLWEYYFTEADLKAAVFDSERGEWVITDEALEVYTIKVYELDLIVP